MYSFDERAEKLKEPLNGIFSLGQLLAAVLGEPMHIYARVKSKNTGLVLAAGAWVGKTVGVDLTKSRADWIAPWKLATVLQMSIEAGVLVKSPNPDWEHSCPWNGAVRLLIDDLDVAVICSKWDERHDLLLASLLLYHVQFSILQFHHIGIRFPTMEAYAAANFRLEQKATPLVRPADDHLRTYFKLWAWPVGYVEHQFFPNGPHDNARHWDLQAADPLGFLQFIGDALDTAPISWEFEENSPVGMVKVQPTEEGEVLSVMVRPTWTPVEDW